MSSPEPKSPILPTHLKDVSVQLLIFIFHPLTLVGDELVFIHQSDLPVPHVFDFVGQTQDLIQLALPAVLRRHLVLTSSTDVSDQAQLRFAQVVF